MAALGARNNNFGNLLGNSAGGGQSWLGQTGTTSANGLGYATFDTPSDGIRALAVDLKNAIGEGFNTLTTLVAHYLGNPVSGGVIQPTSANPNPMSYLQAVAKASGLSANSTVSAANVSSIAEGIIQAEGNAVSGVTGINDTAFTSGISSANLPSQTGNTSLLSGLTSGSNTVASGNTGLSVVFSDFPSGYQPMDVGLSGQTSASVANEPYTSQIQAGPGDVVSSAISGIGAASTSTFNAIDSVAGSISGVQGFISNLFTQANLERTVFIILGILLLAGAVITLSKSYAPAGGGQTPVIVPV